MYFSNANMAQKNYPPFLEKIAVKEKDGSIGLNGEGRTVSWMRATQSTIMDISANVGKGVASIIGVFIYGGLALKERDLKVLKQGFEKTHEAGYGSGLAVGAVAGSVIASVVVPPVSGLINLFWSYNLEDSQEMPPLCDISSDSSVSDDPDILDDFFSCAELFDPAVASLQDTPKAVPKNSIIEYPDLDVLSDYGSFLACAPAPACSPALIGTSNGGGKNVPNADDYSEAYAILFDASCLHGSASK